MEKMPIGRYRGTSLAKVPRPYMLWLVRQPRIRPDLRLALKKRLGIVTAPLLPATVDYKLMAAGDCE